MSGAVATIAVGAAIGAAVGGISAAVQGGDIGMGILGGAAGGALTGGLASPIGGALGGGLAGSIGGGLIAGAAGGALNSAITGGDVASGAMMGGVMGGVMGGFNYSAGPSVNADGSLGVGAPDVSGAGASSVDASGAATGSYGDPLGSGYGAGEALMQGPTSNGATLDAAMLQTQGNSSGLGALSQPVTVEPLGAPGSMNAGYSTAVDPAQLSQAQQILQTQGPSSPNFQALPTDVKIAAINAGNVTAPAAPAATTMGQLSSGPMGGAYDSVNPLQRGLINTSNAANSGLYSMGYGGVQPPAATTAGASAANASTPWGTTGNALVDGGLNWAQKNPGTLAVGGLGALSMLSGSGQSAPATAAPGAAQNTSTYWNSPLPTYTQNRAVTVPPAGYRQGTQGEWMYFPAKTLQPTVAMKKGGKVSSAKSGLGALSNDNLPGGQDDRVPAVLAQDEYVVPADVVAHLGDGSSNAGGSRLDSMVKSVRRHKASAGSKFPPRARSPLAYVKG